MNRLFCFLKAYNRTCINKLDLFTKNQIYNMMIATVFPNGECESKNYAS